MLLLPVVAALLLFLLSPFSVYAEIDFQISPLSVENDVVTLQVQISGSSTPYYLQGMFKSSDHNRYFGQTQNHYGDWLQYTGSPKPEFIKTNFYKTDPQDSSWSGQIKVKNHPADPDYKGPGDYQLKLCRYTGNSQSAAGDSNIIAVHLAYVIPTPTPTPTPSPTSTPTPTPTSTPTSTPTPSPTVLSQVTTTLTTSPTQEASPASLVLGESESTPSSQTASFNPSPTSLPVSEKSSFPRFVIILGGLLSVTSLGLWGRRQYRHFRADDKISL